MKNKERLRKDIKIYLKNKRKKSVNDIEIRSGNQKQNLVHYRKNYYLAYNKQMLSRLVRLPFFSGAMAIEFPYYAYQR